MDYLAENVDVEERTASGKFISGVLGKTGGLEKAINEVDSVLTRKTSSALGLIAETAIHVRKPRITVK